jgi:sec-independent protein translocase protein TatA
MLSSILLGMLGPTEIILIVLVVLLLFGGRKIPELMRGLGRGIKEFKDGMNNNTPEKEEKNKPDR